MQRFAVLPLLFASACLGSITEGDPDSPPDDPVPPQPVTDVRITVRDAATPQAGVKVVFQSPDDAVIAETVTDASGVASAKMPTGGHVTVVREYGPTPHGQPGPIDHVYTYIGVKPGDILELAGELHDDTPYYAKVTFGLTNGEFLAVTTPCGQGFGHAPTIEIELRGCGAETDFFVVNYSGETDEDGVNSGPLYFATHANLAAEIDFTGETFRGTLTTEMTATNLPEMAISMQKRLVTGTFTMFDSGILGTAVATEVPELPTVDQIVSAHLDDYAGRAMTVASRSAFTSAPTTLDLASSVIPMSRAPSVIGSLLEWSEAGPAAATPDLALATITVGAVDRQFVHRVAAPYTGTSLRIPRLPGVYGRYNVVASDTPRIEHQLVRVTEGYDGVRPRVFNHAGADLAPVGGHATVTAAAVSGPTF